MTLPEGSGAARRLLLFSPPALPAAASAFPGASGSGGRAVSDPASPPAEVGASERAVARGGARRERAAARRPLTVCTSPQREP